MTVPLVILAVLSTVGGLVGVGVVGRRGRVLGVGARAGDAAGGGDVGREDHDWHQQARDAEEGEDHDLACRVGEDIGLPPDAEVNMDVYEAAIHPDDLPSVRRAIHTSLTPTHLHYASTR